MNSERLIAVVTGGAGDLGKDIVSKLESNGIVVYVIDLKEPESDRHYKVDLCDEQEVEKVISDIINKEGKINILVNNAGVIHSEPLINITNQDSMRHSYTNFSKYLKLNLDTTFIVSSIIAEKMVQKRTKGVIINMSSISAVGNAGQSAYSAAKAGVEALTKTWSKELGVFGIRSVGIAPGFIDTNSTSHALNENIISHIKKNTPLRKLGKVDNISETVLFAISNDYLNGTVINVDGGLTI